MTKKPFFYLSGILSFSIYFAFIILFLLYINAPKPKKFDSAKTTVLELELITTKADEKKVAKKVIEKKQEIVKKATSKSSKQSANAKSLFANVSTKAKTIEKKEVNTAQESIDPSRFKSKFEKQVKSDNTSVSKLLNDLETTTNMPKILASGSGKEHEYFSKIKQLLWERWTPRLLETGLVVKVLVMITSDGTFDYRIISYSKDERFDKSLKEFLDTQKEETFPTHKINNKVDIIVNFKSEG